MHRIFGGANTKFLFLERSHFYRDVLFDNNEIKNTFNDEFKH